MQPVAAELLTFLIFMLACCKTSLRICETESCPPFSQLTASLVHSVHPSSTRSLDTSHLAMNIQTAEHWQHTNCPSYQHRRPINTFKFSDFTSEKVETSAFQREEILCRVLNVKQATTLCIWHHSHGLHSHKYRRDVQNMTRTKTAHTQGCPTYSTRHNWHYETLWRSDIQTMTRAKTAHTQGCPTYSTHQNWHYEALCQNSAESMDRKLHKKFKITELYRFL
jgi:hypothetical protein